MVEEQRRLPSAFELRDSAIRARHRLAHEERTHCMPEKPPVRSSLLLVLGPAEQFTPQAQCFLFQLRVLRFLQGWSASALRPAWRRLRRVQVSPRIKSRTSPSPLRFTILLPMKPAMSPTTSYDKMPMSHLYSVFDRLGDRTKFASLAHTSRCEPSPLGTLPDMGNPGAVDSHIRKCQRYD
jgi:hypothetical protein